MRHRHFINNDWPDLTHTHALHVTPAAVTQKVYFRKKTEAQAGVHTVRRQNVAVYVRRNTSQSQGLDALVWLSEMTCLNVCQWLTATGRASSSTMSAQRGVLKTIAEAPQGQLAIQEATCQRLS